MSKETSHEAIFERLRQLAPRVVFSIGWDVDTYTSWDGEGPDPRDLGMSCYNATVYAKTIVQGKLVEGSKCLGSVWDFPNQKDRDIHGYLPQMLQEAADELADNLMAQIEAVMRADIEKQLLQVGTYLDLVMRRISEEQQQERDKREGKSK